MSKIGKKKISNKKLLTNQFYHAVNYFSVFPVLKGLRSPKAEPREATIAADFCSRTVSGVSEVSPVFSGLSKIWPVCNIPAVSSPNVSTEFHIVK